jgi:uncharacterized membrane protein
MQALTRNIITGILTIFPLAVTVWVVWSVVDLLIDIGRPIVAGIATAVRPSSSDIADLLLTSGFQSALALIATLTLLAFLGRAANAVIGRRLLRALSRLMDAIPLARTVYGATRTLLDAVRTDTVDTGTRPVVLIEFPNPEMRAVGIVTRIFPATEEREELAAVYVATTPNPTSGFVEIVPTSRLIWLDWSRNDAVAFIISGGAMAPDNIRLHNRPRAAGDEPPPAPTDPAGQVSEPAPDRSAER